MIQHFYKEVITHYFDILSSLKRVIETIFARLSECPQLKSGDGILGKILMRRKKFLQPLSEIPNYNFVEFRRIAIKTV